MQHNSKDHGLPVQSNFLVLKIFATKTTLSQKKKKGAIGKGAVSQQSN